MRLVLEALEAQRNYVPRTSVRLASIATFILRIARHEGWEEEANQLLAAWAGEQTDYSMTEDDVSIALTRWIGGADWKPDVELTSSMLNAHLCQAMGVTERGKDKLNWRGNHLVLSKMLVRNGKVYAERFGMERQKSTLRTSRGTNTYRFDPTPERLADLQAAARYERENVPREPDMEPDSRF